MILIACFVIAAVVAIAIARALGGGGRERERARAFARARLVELGGAMGWQLDAGGVLRNPENGTTVALADPRYEYEDGGMAIEIPGRRCEIGLAVFVREPPDSAYERWGPEVPTGDEVFDARFMLLTRAPREQWLPLLDDEARKALLDLETPALLTEGDRLLLLLPSVPDAAFLRRAIAALSRIRRALPAPPAPPYRQG